MKGLLCRSILAYHRVLGILRLPTTQMWWVCSRDRETWCHSLAQFLLCCSVGIRWLRLMTLMRRSSCYITLARLSIGLSLRVSWALLWSIMVSTLRFFRYCLKIVIWLQCLEFVFGRRCSLSLIIVLRLTYGWLPRILRALIFDLLVNWLSGLMMRNSIHVCVIVESPPLVLRSLSFLWLCWWPGLMSIHFRISCLLIFVFRFLLLLNVFEIGFLLGWGCVRSSLLMMWIWLIIAFIHLSRIILLVFVS